MRQIPTETAVIGYEDLGVGERFDGCGSGRRGVTTLLCALPVDPDAGLRETGCRVRLVAVGVRIPGGSTDAG